MSKTTTDVHYNAGDCRAIISSRGAQCENSGKPELCGTHAKSNNYVRVDEFDAAPDDDLRDTLVEETDLTGEQAYALAVFESYSLQNLWEHLATLRPVSVGPYEWDAKQAAYRARNLIAHPDVDAGDHPFAAFEDRCIALTGAGSKNDRCPNGSYGTGLLCGMHQDAADPRTLFDEPADWPVPDYQAVPVDGDEQLLVRHLDSEVLLLDPATWELHREDLEVLDAARDKRAQIDALDAPLHEVDAPLRPPLLEGIDEGDALRITLVDGETVTGEVTDVGKGGWSVTPGEAHVNVYVEAEYEGESVSLRLFATRNLAMKWSQVTADWLYEDVDANPEEIPVRDVARIDDTGGTDESPSATFCCVDCGNVVEDAPMRVGTCVECGGEMVVDDSAADEDTGTLPIDVSLQERELGHFPYAGKTVVLVGCGSAKREGEHAAKDLYTSNYFAKKRAYAEVAGDVWYVLSAEYGLLAPNEVVESYDTHIDEVDVQEWEADVRADLPPLHGATVEVLAGPDYVDALDVTLDMWADEVRYPTEGLKVGERMQWLTENMPDEPPREAPETEPQPPESLPKYLREGAQKQDVDSLRDLATYAQALADYREAAAERAVEEASEGELEETPEEWDEEEWQEAVEEARDAAEIPATKGTLTTKTIDGNDYYYLQWSQKGKTKSKYIAPVVPKYDTTGDDS